MKLNFPPIRLLYKIIVASFIPILLISCREDKTIVSNNIQPKKHILLLGASIGEAWDFPHLSTRLNDFTHKYEFIAKYEPDKSDILNQVLKRKETLPDIIIIKQCAAYFKSSSDTYDSIHIEAYKLLASKWVKQCRKKNIDPLLATVIPVTEKLPLWNQIKRLIKKHILRKNITPYFSDIRLKGICDYNDWVRDYSKANGLKVLDLESLLRISNSNRHLKPDLSTDGLHINQRAYKLLDQLVIHTLANFK